MRNESEGESRAKYKSSSGGLHRQKSINGPEKGAGGSVGRRMSLKEKERGTISPGTLGDLQFADI